MDELSIKISGYENASLLAAITSASFKKSLALDSRLSTEVFAMEGMSGKKYRSFINNLIGALPDARYLEVGSWLGSTACAAMSGNCVRLMCIDNWSQFDGPKNEFFENIKKFKGTNTRFDFIETDFRKVEFKNIGRFNVYLFDGPHGHEDQYDGLMLALPALDDEFIYIVDDWNASFVRDGTTKAILAADLDHLYSFEIRTTQDDTHAEKARQESDWHNGYFVGIYRKRPKRVARADMNA